MSGSRRSRGRPRFRIGRGPPIRTGDASQTAGCAREPPFAREPGRFRPNVSQFVDVERTGSCRRRERRRNRPLCGERLNTQMHICLREPGRKPAPSVGAIVGTDVLLAALRTHPDSPPPPPPPASDPRQGGSHVNPARGSRRLQDRILRRFVSRCLEIALAGRWFFP